MKLAVLSESSPDEAALRILGQGILNTAVEPSDGPPIRTRGWPSVRAVLPAVIKHLYYQTGADGLIIVVDSDGPLIHQAGHRSAAPCREGCRLCELRALVQRTAQSLTPRVTQPQLKLAVGLAVPAIEAWYRVGRDARINEAAWIQGHQSTPPRPPYSKLSLKQDVYGTDRPGLVLEMRHAVEEAHRLTNHIPELIASFPGGFRPLVEDLQGW